MVIAPEHDRADLAAANHLVELQGNTHPPGAVLVENTRLGADHQVVLLRIAYPDIVVAILSPAAGVDTGERGLVSFNQLFRLAAQANPAEGPVTVVEELGSHDIFNVGRPDKTIFLVASIFGNFLNPCIEDRFHERVAVVEKVAAPFNKGLDQLVMFPQAAINQFFELSTILGQKAGALVKGKPLGTVTAVVRGMAGGLIREQLYRHLMVNRILKQVHDIAVVGDGKRLLPGQRFPGQGEGFGKIVRGPADPALIEPGLNTRPVHLGDEAHAAGDLDRFWLGAAHPAKPGGDKKMAPEVSVFGNAELQAAGVEQGVEGAVDDPLRPDIHPSPGGHLAVIGHAHLGGNFPVALVVEKTHHEPVGDNRPGSTGVRGKEAQGMTRDNHESLLLGERLQVFFDQAVLQPVLADAAGFTVGDQFIGVQGHLEIEIVVDHELKGFPGSAISPVLLDGPGVDSAGGTVAVGVNPPPGQ